MDHKDRKVALVVFGVLEIIFGVLCALVIPLMILSMVASSRLAESGCTEYAVSPAMMVPGLLFYAVLAVFFIWMGIGSIHTRRWARAIWAVVSWMWFAAGIMGGIAVLFLMSSIFNPLVAEGVLNQNTLFFVNVITFGVVAVFYLLIPGILALFYSSRNVKATCELRDARERWTDKCPLPVLAVTLFAGSMAAGLLLMGFYGWAIPFCGIIVHGPMGAGVVFAVFLVLLYIGWGAYHLSMRAWWCALVLAVCCGVSTFVTFLSIDMIDYYRAMGLTEQQLKFSTFSTDYFVIFACVWTVIVAFYLLYIRRYFIMNISQTDA